MCSSAPPGLEGLGQADPEQGWGSSRASSRLGRHRRSARDTRNFPRLLFIFLTRILRKINKKRSIVITTSEQPLETKQRQTLEPRRTDSLFGDFLE